MPRDYKRAGSSRRDGSKPIGAWLPFVTGLMIGLFVAFVMYLQGQRPEMPAAAPEPAPAVAQSPAPAAVPASPPAPAEPATEKPKFDFYTILPEMEVKVPEWELDTPAQVSTERGAPESYVLQVGSFQRFEEADRVKANLALSGIAATIQPVTINGEDQWFRVRVGPFTDFEALSATRTRLADAGVDFMLLRIKSGESP